MIAWLLRLSIGAQAISPVAAETVLPHPVCSHSMPQRELALSAMNTLAAGSASPS